MKYTGHGVPARYNTSSETIDARADIKLKPCERCRLRGHYCEAQTTGDDEEPLCVFCADGVTCLHERVEAKRQKAMPAKLGPEILQDAIAKAKGAPAPPSRKPRNPKSPWRGPASLNLSNARPEPPPSAAPAEPETKKETHPVKHDNDNPPVCSVEGCTTPLGKKNRTGRCAPHYYVRKGKRGSSARRATPPRKLKTKRGRPASGAPKQDGVVTICVTETNLDNFWQKLSLEEKAELYQRQLEGA
jgi:hypothetical protein